MDLLTAAFSNLWSIFLVVVFFGGSIFVLAARRRGVLVERFSIGFGPAIWSHRAKDGVEYRIAWFPLGGYVLLPQLADLGPIEGESTANVAKLPPISYSTKMIVFVAGASFNVLFAFALACIISVIGLPESSVTATTRIGYVAKTLEGPDGAKSPSPALVAGFRAGDVVRAIDGKTVTDWQDLMQTLITTNGRSPDGQPRAVFTIDRNGELLDLPVNPRLSGEEKFRKIGIAPGFELIAFKVAPKGLAATAGLRVDDEFVSANGVAIYGLDTLYETLSAASTQPATLKVRRVGAVVALTLPSHAHDTPAALGKAFGVDFITGFRMTHPSPITQITAPIVMTVRTLWSLINPSSDIGLSKLAGPVGIVRIFHSAAEAGFRAVLMFTILININLAVFNLLPIPVLDGGQMLFATIGKLRGRALPVNFIMTAQSVFMVLLFSMVIYVSFFDVRRIVRDVNTSRAEAASAAAPAAPAIAPAK
jgi:regulator of sigma E protease